MRKIELLVIETFEIIRREREKKKERTSLICAENNRRTPFNAYNRKHKTQFAWQNHIDIDITLINKVKSHNRLPGDTVFSRIGTN